jgi:hypothetical protein
VSRELRRDEKIVAWKTRRKLGKTAVENENDLHFDKKKETPKVTYILGQRMYHFEN